MKTISNQTVYQCEGCGKRFLTKHRALEHEREYCKKHPKSKKNPDNCPHEKISTEWTPIYGEEHRMEPDYDYCENCGTKF